jgi:hypothetical protein
MADVMMLILTMFMISIVLIIVDFILLRHRKQDVDVKDVETEIQDRQIVLERFTRSATIDLFEFLNFLRSFPSIVLIKLHPEIELYPQLFRHRCLNERQICYLIYLEQQKQSKDQQRQMPNHLTCLELYTNDFQQAYEMLGKIVELESNRHQQEEALIIVDQRGLSSKNPNFKVPYVQMKKWIKSHQQIWMIQELTPYSPIDLIYPFLFEISIDQSLQIQIRSKLLKTIIKQKLIIKN